MGHFGPEQVLKLSAKDYHLTSLMSRLARTNSGPTPPAGVIQKPMPGLSKNLVTLRPFPYPYRAGLAICNDIDGTKTLERFLTIQEFLNTGNDTRMEQGLGLEIGNSFFPYTPDDSFGYFSSRPADREVIETLIKSGYIDCLHSFGDGAHSRADVLRALDELERSGCKLDVWVDHSRAPSNFGKDTTPGLGDVPGSPIYHADATLAYGIKFVWMGRGSSIVGHGVPFSLGSFTHLFDPAHPGHTTRNIAKELVKTILAYMGNRRFAIHCHNRLVRVACLRDGQYVYEFNRCNNYWRGLAYGHNRVGLAYVIRRKALTSLIDAGGYMIIYTHLGIGPDDSPLIPTETQNALRGLAEAYRVGEIYVSTTSRLLSYHLNHCCLQWSYGVSDEGWTLITIHGVADPLFGPHLPTVEELQGITFYVPDRRKANIRLGNDQLTTIERNAGDHTGKESINVPRTFLSYPLPVPYEATKVYRVRSRSI